MDESKFGDLVVKCWRDAEFKKRFITDPKKVLAELGIELPAELDLQVVENTDKRMYLVLPPPPAKAPELTDAQLDQVTGGAGNIPTSPTNATSPTITQDAIRKVKLPMTMANQTTCTTAQRCTV